MSICRNTGSSCDLTSLSEIKDRTVQRKKTWIVRMILLGLINAGATVFNARFRVSLLGKHARNNWVFGFIMNTSFGLWSQIKWVIFA